MYTKGSIIIKASYYMNKEINSSDIKVNNKMFFQRQDKINKTPQWICKESKLPH